MTHAHCAPVTGAVITNQDTFDNLITPVRGTIIEGICLDCDDAKLHEDLLRITKQGNLTQIDIAVVVPPSDCFSKERLVTSLLDLTQNKTRQFIQVIERHRRSLLGLQEKDTRNVLVATYVLNEKHELIQEDFDYSSAIGTMITFTSYDESEESKETLCEIRRLLNTKPDLKKRVLETLTTNFPRNGGSSFLITHIAMQLFNDTAATSAKKRKIPFIKRPSTVKNENYFTMNYAGSIFSRSLRDPCGLVNALNFYAHFRKIDLPFTRKTLRKMIPFKGW